MNRNYLCVLDLETGGRNTDTAPILQIGAIIAERNTLRVIDEFNSLLKPIDFSLVENEALQVNKLTIPQLEAAPETSIVWQQFVDWVNKYNISKKVGETFGAPIPCGYNHINYDMKIISRYCKQYGQWDSKWNSQKLFNAVFHIDVMQHLFFWFENNPEIKSISLVSALEYMGMPKNELENAHDAMVDVRNTWAILERLIKAERFLTTKDPQTKKRRLEIKNCMKEKSN